MAEPAEGLDWELTESGCVARLIGATGEVVPFQKWRSHSGAMNLVAFSTIQALVQAGVATTKADGSVFLHCDEASKLDRTRAQALDLPPPVPYMLEVDSKGDFSIPNMRLESQWFNERRLRVRNVRRSGLSLNAEGRVYALVYPFYQILAALDRFNLETPATPAARLAAWGDIQTMIGVDKEHVQADRFLSSIRVVRATHFTVDITPDAGGRLQIAPVPLVHREAPRTEEIPTGGSPLAFDSPLTGLQRAKFQRAFELAGTSKPSYVAGDNVHVVPSPELQKALEVVRQMQQASPDERLQFVQNPFAFLKTEDGEGTEPPFVESRSYSDRIRGLGEPERPVLPWQILASQGWLPPESVSIDVNGTTLRMKPENLDPAIADIEAAMADKRETVAVEGTNLPATISTHDVFLAARQRLDQAASTPATVHQLEEETKPERPTEMTLLVKRNLDQSEYRVGRRPRQHKDFDIPAILSTLKIHQRQAVSWLQQRWAAGFNGALLADDMGLGKSVTTLTFMVWLRRQMREGSQVERPMLVVAPVTLLENWQNEHDVHIGEDIGFSDIVHAYGSKVPRARSGRDKHIGGPALDLDRLTTDRFGQPTLVLTSYETLRDYQFSFAACHFGLVAFDEAQRLKNPASLAWAAAASLKSDFWLALTGTPVENRLADLWSILDIVEPDFFPPLREFSATYEAGFDEVRLRELKARLEGASGSEPALMLRRMKDQVLDGLPTKTASVVARVMPTVQELAYDDVIEQARNPNDKSHILHIIGRMREISLHPHAPGFLSGDSFVAASARFSALFEVLDELYQKGERSLIFLDRLEHQPFLAGLIQERYSLAEFPLIINGEVPPSRRKALVDAFQEQHGFAVMILSPKAAGVGLTLTNANNVIHLSRWWNPAVEDQCTDRVYRIGQTKPVSVYYIQAQHSRHQGGSFDERLHELLETKRALSRELLWPGSSDDDDAALLIAGTTPSAATS